MKITQDYPTPGRGRMEVGVDILCPPHPRPLPPGERGIIGVFPMQFWKEALMKLDLEMLDIKDIQCVKKTVIDNGVLFINRQELQELLQKDKKFSHVDIELAHPGEKIRIVHVTEVIEPRAKSAGSGMDFH